MTARRWLSICALSLVTTACTASVGADGAAGSGVVVAELATAPADVSCVRVRARDASGASLSDERVDVVAGDATEIAMAGLPEEELTFRADAYAQRCDSIGSAHATWSSADVPFVVSARRVQTLQLELRPNRSTDVGIDFDANIVGIALGNVASAVVRDDGSAIGRGNTPMAPLAGLRDVAQVSIGHLHACAVLGNGELWCWGDNLYGQLGIGTTPAWSDTARRVAIPAVRQVVAESRHTCAVTRSGTLYCWGLDDAGQIASGVLGSSRPLPFVAVGGNVAQVASDGSHTCVRLATGGVSCTGQNSVGQLGNGTTTSTSGFVSVTGLRSTTDIAVLAGVASYARLADGTMRAWGAFGTRSYGSVPLVFSAPAVARVDEIVSASGAAACALSDGRVLCWGFGENAGVSSTATYVLDPTEVMLPARATAVFGGGSTTCALLEDGNAWCWGRNASDLLGLGTIDTQFSPVEVRW